MNKYAIRYGLIIGLMLGLSFLLAGLFFKQEDGTMDFDAGMIAGYTGMALSLIVVYLGIRAYRNGPLNGEISFARALGMGAYLVGLASVVYALFWEWYFTNYASDFMEQYTNYKLSKMESAGASLEDITAFKSEMSAASDMYKNPVIRFFWTILEYFPIGFGGSLIAALILKTPRKTEVRHG